MKILIVDDAKETRESLFNIIKAKIDDSYEIKEAEDGLDALLVVDSFKPDIVLTDVLMPNMDGMRFTSILKSQPQTQHIFIAAITGLSGEEEIKKIYASGVDFYISKPFQLDDVVARLKVITSLVSHKGFMSETKSSVVYNCFKDDNIKHYHTTFSITKEDDILLIFDYFSDKRDEDYSNVLKDLMVTLFKAYRKIDDKTKTYDLIIEESEQYTYLTMRDKSFVQAFESLIKKHDLLLEYSASSDAFSFRINIAFIEKSTVALQKEVLYRNELMSAAELMNVSSDDLEIYVQELQESLLYYRSLCNQDNEYNPSLQLLLANLFDQYTRLFKKVPEFERVSVAVQSVAILIKKAKTKKFDKVQNIKLIRDIEELNVIIETWIHYVITTQSSKDVHSDEYKIMNSCRVLEKYFS